MDHPHSPNAKSQDWPFIFEQRLGENTRSCADLSSESSCDTCDSTDEETATITEFPSSSTSKEKHFNTSSRSSSSLSNSTPICSDSEESADEIITSRGAAKLSSRQKLTSLDTISNSPTSCSSSSSVLSYSTSNYDSGSYRERPLTSISRFPPRISPREVDPEPRPTHRRGYPPIGNLPPYFPSSIKKIYIRDRNGGALKYKVSLSPPPLLFSKFHATPNCTVNHLTTRTQELHTLLSFHSTLSTIHHSKFISYLPAAHARFALHQILERHRPGKTIAPKFYQYRKRQFEKWDREALARWKKLERVQWGMEVLNETLGLNFRQERLLYRKRLGEMKW